MTDTPSNRRRPLRIDLHTHLAGVGTQGSGCWVSPHFQRRMTFRALRLLFRITDAQMRATVDQDWAARLAASVADSELDHAVALGFDGVYDADGRLDREHSQMVVPPGWVFHVCERYPELLPGPSVNPHRRDAIERLDECIARGATLIKWLPSAQRIDPAAPLIRPFLRRMADVALPLLVHAGTGENTFRMIAPELHGLERLVPALEMGVTVIVAHAAGRIHFAREPDAQPELRRMVRRYPHLWVDNSGLANPARFRHLVRLLDDPVLLPRTLHGSDFPVPPNPLLYPRQIGVRRATALQREHNLLQRDLELKRALGFPEASFTRASALLPNLL